jgi:RNase P protein component
VTRNLVKRRLRHIMKNWLDAQRGHTATSYLEGDVVVRALPASAQATYTQLNDDVKSALHSAIMAG